MRERDPQVCERCRVIYDAQVARSALWLHRGELRCCDLRACDGRMAIRDGLDALVEHARLTPHGRPQEGVRRPPVLAHVPAGRRPGGRP